VFALITWMVLLQKKRYAQHKASNHKMRMREYTFISTVLSVLTVASLIVAVVALFFIGEVSADNWIVALLCAGIQVGIVLLKTLFFCWIFVWVRWTLPRFRYDQIMDLGWKIMLNVALVNLAITAFILKVLE
ncbi:MAG: NADH-quinone oxidoreductase subunit H, partial [Planctomycetes bacterium]|nr:NADH-quinone oxidoreductase subunit H [Planctomycetota bacterium]